MNKIVLDEDFNLIDIYNTLLESRGVIDNVDGMVYVITNFINKVLFDNTLKENCYGGYNKKEDVDTYRFPIPVELFNNVNCLFIKEPIFYIEVFVMRNKFGDIERELGQTCYIEEYYPKLINSEQQYYLLNPEFHLSFVIPKDEKINFFVVADKLSHELVHAKRNFYEFIRMSEKRKESLKYNAKTMELLSSSEKEDIRHLVGRILYLCSYDEINARANQLYYQLKQYNDINRQNINRLVKKTDVYKFIIEIEDKLKELNDIELSGNHCYYNYIWEILKTIFKMENLKNDPYEFLINLLISRKNYFIRQIDKVKEKVLFEKEREPIIMR